jgi:small subunit ribosomal protein S4
MGRYTGPKGRVNRRLGALVFEDAGATRALDQRNLPPGMSQRRRKASNFGLALIEKQKIKFYYGLRERQLRRYFDKARRIRGNTGEALLILCERRLDNVVCRAGFAMTRPQARQGIVHSHFQLNGQTVNKPSIWVKPGDVITVRNRPNLKKLYGESIESNRPGCAWITMDKKSLEASVVTAPGIEDVSLPVDVGQVVALISR